ncbi:TauD/TfdA family dioxygenase [Pseudomonadales bacterium]|nr:TauD/TfdA family dioxygenase [Pseudomonadales bacterium]
MKINPINRDFVADVDGIDIGTISDEDFEAVYQAWLQFGVLRLHDQPLDEESLQQFSRRFGPLEERPMGRLPAEARAKIKNRYVTQLSNIVENGKPIGGLGNSEANWHSDMTYVDTPPPASILLGIEIPEVGGNTYFADQQAAYEALPEALRTRAETLSIKHDAAHTSVGSLRPGFEAFDDPRQAPGAVHPIIRTHEETGKKVLYLGRREWAFIPGLSLDDSETLLDELWSYAATDSNTWGQQWQPRDLIIWDNRRVLHRRDDFPADSRRLMKRCQVLARSI